MFNMKLFNKKESHEDVLVSMPIGFKKDIDKHCKKTNRNSRSSFIVESTVKAIEKEKVILELD